MPTVSSPKQSREAQIERVAHAERIAVDHAMKVLTSRGFTVVRPDMTAVSYPANGGYEIERAEHHVGPSSPIAGSEWQPAPDSVRSIPLTLSDM